MPEEEKSYNPSVNRDIIDTTINEEPEEETTEENNEETTQESAEEAKSIAEKMINDMVTTLKTKQNDFNKTISEMKTTKPAVDVYESEEYVLVKLDIPRVNKEDITINTNGNSLEIITNFPEEEICDELKAIKKERCSGTTKNIIVLPAEIDTNKVEASFKEQVLTITLYKPESSKTAVEIN
ncbi:MAG: Hsp20/alpha crystallin family protein [Methanobacteriaceae archaeon]|nr:Hsp20/alpha crystallin family protein [Methanobacteriaceae archaeon]